MENIDRLVELITDRLLENLQHSPDTRPIYLIGGERTAGLLTGKGYQLTSDMEGADCILVDSLALDSFLRIAALCPTNEIESGLLAALLKGKRVLVARETFDVNQYKNSAKTLLYRELLQQKAKLEKYGLQFYEKDQLLSLLSQEKADRKERQTALPSAAGPSKKSSLVTEAKLKGLDLSEGDSFQLEKGMIITALARDYLKRHKIRIVE